MNNIFEFYFALTVKMRFRLNFADFTKFFQIYQIPWVSLPFSNTGKFSKGSDFLTLANSLRARIP
jgi:hypothetical protein